MGRNDLVIAPAYTGRLSVSSANLDDSDHGSLQGNILNDVASLNWFQFGTDLIALGGRYVAEGEAVLNYIKNKELPSKGLAC